MSEKIVKKSDSVLISENVRLYEENLKLKAKIEKLTSNKNTVKPSTTKDDTKSTKTKASKNTKNTDSIKSKAVETKENSTKKTNEVKTTVKEKTAKPTELEKSMKNNDKKNLSKFQAERESKKDVVAKNRKKNISISEIAKMIGQSEPTVRNYIRELRLEGRLA